MSCRQRNIVFIMADQLGASALGCYGCPVDASPNIDRLAKEGTKFNRHYIVNPVCGPARASIFTGRTSARTGVYYNNIEMSRDLLHFTEVLKENGYRTGGFGKFHFTDMGSPLPDDMADYGFDESIISDDTKYGKWIEWIKAEHPDCYETALSTTWPRDFDTEEHRQRFKAAFEKHMRDRIKAPYDYVTYVSPLPAELHQTTYITDRSMDFIERAAESEQPFMCFISYVDPHDPYDPPEPYASLFDPQEIPDPIEAEWLGRPPPVYERSLNSPRAFNLENDIVPLKNYMVEDWQRLRAHFFGSVKFIDDQLGRIFKLLEDKGLMENTVLIFTSDHGEMLGDHKLLTKGFKHYDQAIRSPMIIKTPTDEEPGRSIDKLTCNLDIYPTICELAGIDMSGFSLDGKSMLPLLRDQSCTLYNDLLIQFDHEREDRCIRTIVTDDNYRLSIFPGQNYGELFNLKEDPDEQKNLFFDSEWISRKSELMERLLFQMNRFIHSAYRDEQVNLPADQQFQPVNTRHCRKH